MQKEQDQKLTPPKLVRSSAVQHPDSNLHQLDCLRQFDFALKYELLTVMEMTKILGVSRPEASQFYQQYLHTKNLLSTLYYFFNRNQLQQVLSNILYFY
jgi:hypothetical protein